MSAQHHVTPLAHRTPPLFNIPELLDSVCSHIEEPEDLVNLSCASKCFTDACMRVLWFSPVFDGSPLEGMVHLFPKDLRRQLRESNDRSMRLPAEAFVRFDHYARYIRSLHLWHNHHESYIAWVLTQSRPGVWLFPRLVDLHLGASGDVIQTVPMYFTPTMHTLRLNHWDIEGHREMNITPELRSSLLAVCSLPALDKLDLADTLYTDLEDDAEVIQAFASLAGRLSDFRAQAFLTLPTVFAASSRNPRLATIFINVADQRENHAPLDDVISAIQYRFVALRELGLFCEVEQAVRLLEETQRCLTHVDLKIESVVEVVGLRNILAGMFPGMADTLVSFRLVSPANLISQSDPPLRLSEALHPMQAYYRIQNLKIDITFGAQQMMRDPDLISLIRFWPDLKSFVLRCDSDDDALLAEEEDTGDGVSLKTIAAIAQYCPWIETVVLPFIDTAEIPDTKHIHQSTVSFELYIIRSHVHNHDDLRQFVARLWRKASINLSGCTHFGRTRFEV